MTRSSRKASIRPWKDGQISIKSWSSKPKLVVSRTKFSRATTLAHKITKKRPRNFSMQKVRPLNNSSRLRRKKKKRMSSLKLMKPQIILVMRMKGIQAAAPAC